MMIDDDSATRGGDLPCPKIWDLLFGTSRVTERAGQNLRAHARILRKLTNDQGPVA